MDERDDDRGFVGHAAPPRLMLALTGDPRERDTAKAQLWAFGCLQDETEPIWGAYIDELIAEVEREQPLCPYIIVDGARLPAVPGTVERRPGIDAQLAAELAYEKARDDVIATVREFLRAPIRRTPEHFALVRAIEHHDEAQTAYRRYPR